MLPTHFFSTSQTQLNSVVLSSLVLSIDFHRISQMNSVIGEETTIVHNRDK